MKLTATGETTIRVLNDYTLCVAERSPKYRQPVRRQLVMNRASTAVVYWLPDLAARSGDICSALIAISSCNQSVLARGGSQKPATGNSDREFFIQA